MKHKVKYRQYIKSEDWKDRKISYIEKYWDNCNICKRKWKHLHHRNYDRVWEELDSDLILLCANCHKSIHFKKERKNFYKTPLDKKYMKFREERVRLYRSPEKKYKNNRLEYQKRLKKLAKEDEFLKSNLWNNFIEKYGINVYIDFLEIYKETRDFSEIFEMYWLRFDKWIYLSFRWVTGNANKYGFSIDNLIDFCYKYKEFEE